MHVTFDTLEMVRRLEAKGFKREQAEEIISVVKDVQQELATKEDVNLVKKELKSEILATEARLEVKLSQLKTEIINVKAELKGDIAKLTNKVDTLGLSLTVRLGIAMFTILLAFKMLDKYFV